MLKVDERGGVAFFVFANGRVPIECVTYMLVDMSGANVRVGLKGEPESVKFELLPEACASPC
jgi:hypothetical protein